MNWLLKLCLAGQFTGSMLAAEQLEKEARFDAGFLGNDSYQLWQGAGLLPVWHGTSAGDAWMLYLAPTVNITDHSTWTPSLGFGFRQLLGAEPTTHKDGVLIGAYAFADHGMTQDDSTWQASTGIELATTYFRFHANYYLPLENRERTARSVRVRKERYGRTSTSYHREYDKRYYNTDGGTIILDSDQIPESGSEVLLPVERRTFREDKKTQFTKLKQTTRSSFVEALRGWDVEAEFAPPGLQRWGELWLGGGYMAFNGSGNLDMQSWFAGFHYRPVEAITLSATWFPSSTFYDDHWLAGLTVSLPLGGTSEKNVGFFNAAWKALTTRPARAGPADDFNRIPTRKPNPVTFVSYDEITSVITYLKDGTKVTRRLIEQKSVAPRGAVIVIPEPGRTALTCFGLAVCILRRRRDLTSSQVRPARL